MVAVAMRAVFISDMAAVAVAAAAAAAGFDR